MAQQSNQSKKISHKGKDTPNSLKSLVVTQTVQESSTTKVEESVTLVQTYLFYTKPFRKAKKYDFF